MKRLRISRGILILYILSFIIIVAGDQVTKYLVDKEMILGTSYTIIEDFFYFTYIHNSGAAWGILQGGLNIFLVISIICTIGIIYYFIKSYAYQIYLRYGLVLLFSGLVGNLIDRLIFGYVRDFLDFIIIGYDFPVFNIADMAIVIGVCLVTIELIKEEYLTWKLSKSKSTN